MKHALWLVVWLIVALLAGCATPTENLYQQIGGEKKVDEIVDNFITEIEFDPMMFEYFRYSNVERFRDSFATHLCELIDGPCRYEGDNMVLVHGGMNISESEFNHCVDLFISAMTKAEISHPMQNRIIARLVPTRDEIIYK